MKRRKGSKRSCHMCNVDRSENPVRRERLSARGRWDRTLQAIVPDHVGGRKAADVNGIDDDSGVEADCDQGRSRRLFGDAPRVY